MYYKDLKSKKENALYILNDILESTINYYKKNDKDANCYLVRTSLERSLYFIIRLNSLQSK